MKNTIVEVRISDTDIGRALARIAAAALNVDAIHGEQDLPEFRELREALANLQRVVNQ